MEEFPVSLHVPRGSRLAVTRTRFTASDVPSKFLQVNKQIGSGNHIWKRNLTCAFINMTIKENSETKHQQLWHMLLVAVQKGSKKLQILAYSTPHPRKNYISRSFCLMSVLEEISSYYMYTIYHRDKWLILEIIPKWSK